MEAKRQLFVRDIPGVLVQYVKNFLISDFKLVWINTRMPFFTHGIEANHFSNISIRNFSGGVSPINKKASRMYITEGTGFVTDSKLLGVVMTRRNKENNQSGKVVILYKYFNYEKTIL